MTSPNPRQYDLILLGATGYTGKLTAEYITKRLPEDLTWAIAGRNHAKLSQIASDLQTLRPDRKPPAIETTEHSAPALNALVQKTRVLITTVGPYHRHGTPVIEACARAGTHYLDCTGETPWVYEVTKKFHKLAQENKAVLIPLCAMESAPADIAAYVLTSLIREKYSAGTADLVHSIQEFKNGLTGGTLHSLIGMASAYPLSHIQKSLQPFSLCADVLPSVSPRSLNLAGSHNVPGLGLLSDSPIGFPDTALVYRSWSLMNGGNQYGTKFNYFTGQRTKNRVTGFLWHVSLGLSMLMLLVPPMRWLLLKVSTAPGEGPSKEDQAKSLTMWKSIARSDSKATQTAVCNMSFAGDMYSLTAMHMAEAAMVLLRPDRENWAQKIGGGVLTPATLGSQLVERVKAGGLKIETETVEKTSM